MTGSVFDHAAGQALLNNQSPKPALYLPLRTMGDQEAAISPTNESEKEREQ